MEVDVHFLDVSVQRYEVEVYEEFTPPYEKVRQMATVVDRQ